MAAEGKLKLLPETEIEPEQATTEVASGADFGDLKTEILLQTRIKDGKERLVFNIKHGVAKSGTGKGHVDVYDAVETMVKGLLLASMKMVELTGGDINFIQADIIRLFMQMHNKDLVMIKHNDTMKKG